MVESSITPSSDLNKEEPEVENLFAKLTLESNTD